MHQNPNPTTCFIASASTSVARSPISRSSTTAPARSSPYKSLTTPADPARGRHRGRRGPDASAPASAPADVAMVVHGTTLVTNAIIERRGAPTAMIVTRGFRDVLDIAMECRYDLFDLRLRFPAPVVPRELRFEVDERVKWDGSVAEAARARRTSRLDRERNRAARRTQRRGVPAAFLRESRARATDRRLACGGSFHSLTSRASADVFPFMREYARWTTACLNAYVQPVVDDYLDAAGSADWRRLGFRGKFLVMSSQRQHAHAGDRAPLSGAACSNRARPPGVLMSARHSRRSRAAARSCRSTWAARRPRAA